MKIAVASDIHLEIDNLILKNTHNADVLILAGDILVARDLHDHPKPQVPYPPAVVKTLGHRQLKAQYYRQFISHVSFQFPKVIVIAGNHEFYHGEWNRSIETLRAEYSAYPNIHFLERDTITIDDVTFVGGTLWTDFNKGDPLSLHAIVDMMNDYRVIRHDGLGYTKLRPAHTLSRHRDTLSYFKTVIDDRKDSKIVVVSHMAPSSLSIHEQYKNEYLMNGAYYSDLSEFILDRPQIKCWIHGHVHHNFDYSIGECRVVCNPRGYVGHERDSQEIEPYDVYLVDV
jgi:Icc-related predicted phosphoesterase